MKTRLRVNFQTKLLIPLIALLAVLLSGITWRVSRQVTRQMEEDSGRKLATASQVVEDALTQRARNLMLRYIGTANEPSVKATVQSADSATIRFLLKNYIGADRAALMACVGYDGTLLAAAHGGEFESVEDLLMSVDAAIADGLAGTPRSLYAAAAGEVINVVVVPVQVGESPAGALVAAYRLDEKTARELSKLSGVDVVFISGSDVAVSTWMHPLDARTFLNDDAGKNEHEVRRTRLDSEHVMYRAMPVPGVDFSLARCVLVLSYESGLRALRRTQGIILLWSVAGIVASSLFTYFIVRAAGRPLRQLSESAEAVGRGDFTRRVDIRTRDELGDLARVFNQMVENLEQSRAELEKTVDTLRRTQEQLVQREKLSAIGEFIAGVTHELNNPLTSVVGFAHMLKETDLTESQREDLSMIVNGAERCQRIVQGLLRFARRQTPEKKAMDLNAAIRSVLVLAKYDLIAANITIEESLAEGLPLVLADEQQIQQVLLNLITNARHAMEARGYGHLKLTTQFHADRVWAVVKDDGPGIPPNILNRIFDPFFTTKPAGKGTGLGLSVCYGILRDHDGSISVESEPGRGAAFRIELPVAPENAADAVRSSAETRPHGKPLAGRALVVDDEPAILELSSRALEAAGCRVDIALDGRAALERIRTVTYDLVLCDVRMPGFGGLEVFQHVSREHPEIKDRFLFMTGDIINVATQRFLETTGKPFIPKPFTVEQLRAFVARAVADTALPA